MSKPPAAAGVTIRDATPADLDRLVSLENLCFPGDRLSRRSFRHLLASRSAVLRVAGRGGSLLGYALLLLRAGSRVARLYSLAVDPGSRGSGLGALLLADGEDRASRLGRTALRLEVRADNRPAIRLYEARGYRRSGLYPAYYEDGADALRFEKAVGDSGRG